MDKGRIKALVVDDHELLRSGVKVLIKRASGIEVIGESSTGKEGMELVDKLSPDVVVLDVKLPDFSGWGILGLLRMSEAYRRLPVIMISVESAETELVTTYRPDGYLQKPFDVRQLLAVAEKVASVESKRQNIANDTA